MTTTTTTATTSPLADSTINRMAARMEGKGFCGGGGGNLDGRWRNDVYLRVIFEQLPMFLCRITMTETFNQQSTTISFHKQRRRWWQQQEQKPLQPNQQSTAGSISSFLNRNLISSDGHEDNNDEDDDNKQQSHEYRDAIASTTIT